MCPSESTKAPAAALHLEPCPPKPALAQRPLLARRQAGSIARVFKALANDTRLRLLHALTRRGELCMTELAKTVGMKPQAVSNQLQRLATQRIVGCRHEGSQVFYRLVDPCVIELLDRALCLAEDAASRER
jgi:DNA-binding transcriptional ArsR family regulator